MQLVLCKDFIIDPYRLSVKPLVGWCCSIDAMMLSEEQYGQLESVARCLNIVVLPKWLAKRAVMGDHPRITGSWH